MNRSLSNRRRSAGVALIFALIFLGILAGIAVFIAKRANIGMRMAGNAMSKALTFERAEAALPTAETSIKLLAEGMSSGAAPFNCATHGYYAVAGVKGTTGTCKVLTSSSLAWTSADSIASGDGRYAIEYRGKESIVLPEDRLALPVILTEVHVFRIVSQGAESAGGRTVLETVYLRRNSG